MSELNKNRIEILVSDPELAKLLEKPLRKLAKLHGAKLTRKRVRAAAAEKEVVK